VHYAGLDHRGQILSHADVPVISVITEITGIVDLGQVNALLAN
jgi:hypothetical protein